MQNVSKALKPGKAEIGRALRKDTFLNINSVDSMVYKGFRHRDPCRHSGRCARGSMSSIAFNTAGKRLLRLGQDELRREGPERHHEYPDEFCCLSNRNSGKPQRPDPGKPVVRPGPGPGNRSAGEPDSRKRRAEFMTDPMELQRRYFTAQLERFSQKPQLHRAMIEDCRLNLEMLEEAGSPGAFMDRIQRTGNMVSTARANAADRYDNRAHIHEKLGHEGKAEEDGQRLSVIGSAETHAELNRKLEAFEANTALGMNENMALNDIVPLIEALFYLCTDNPGGNDHDRSITKFREYRRQLVEADTGFSWQKLMTHRPYRDRLPFTERQMAILEAKFREVCSG